MNAAPLVFPYTVTAHRKGEEPIHIGLLARGPADAITTAQELFPNRLISTAIIQPDWDDPA